MPDRVISRGALVALGVVAALLLMVGSGESDPPTPVPQLDEPVRVEQDRAAKPKPPERAKPKPKECLERKRVAEARRWAADRAGEISFAVLDECGRLVGDHRYRTHYSASVVKVMLLVAYLRLEGVSDDELTGDEKAMLEPMITMSDNNAANQVFAIVGEAGLYDVARDAGMGKFTTMPSWGGSEITAADQAMFVGEIEHYVPKKHEDYVLELMANVIDPQRWGVPRMPLPGWMVHLKGGWAPQASGGGWRVNQVALLRRHDRRLTVAILTSDNPDFEYGRGSIEGVAKRLLRAYKTKRPPSARFGN